MGLGYFKQNFLIEYVFIKLGYKDHYILNLRIKNTCIVYLLKPTSFLFYIYFTLVHIAKNRLQTYSHFKQIGKKRIKINQNLKLNVQ